MEFEHPVATLTLNDPDRRNALSIAMFDAMDESLEAIVSRDDVAVAVLAGAGSSFCAGFDLASAVGEPGLMGDYIARLSASIRRIRRAPQVVIAAVQGAAVAGGCALLSACDLVVAEADATLGYPVHRLGVSPAVTIPTLRARFGDGRARELLMSGRLVRGAEAVRIGLATHLAEPELSAVATARRVAMRISRSDHHAIRVTKAWLNELDGSLDDDQFDRPVADSAVMSQTREAAKLLRDFWASRRAD